MAPTRTLSWFFHIEAFLGKNHTWLTILRAPFAAAENFQRKTVEILTMAGVWMKLSWDSKNKQLALLGVRGRKWLCRMQGLYIEKRINSAYNKSLLTSSLKTSCAPKPGGIFSRPGGKVHKCWLLFVCAAFIGETLTGFPYTVWANSMENSYPTKTNRDWLITYYHILQLRLWKMFLINFKIALSSIS